MIITLEDTVFCVTGGFRHHHRRTTVEDALREGGATIKQSITDKTQVLIHGYGNSAKLDDAVIRGIPILKEHELIVLLAQGQVEIDFERPSVEGGEEDVNVLLGEARSALAQPPGVDTWMQIVEVLDRCAPEQTEVLVDYVQPHLSRWELRQQMFCVAPDHWLVSMTQGITSASYRVVRWLDLSLQWISATLVRQIIGCEDLTCVRRIDLPSQKHASKSLLKTLSTTSRMESLRVLCFGRLGVDIASGLEQGSALRNVHTLVFRDYGEFKHRRCYLDVLCAKSFEHVTRFRTLGVYGPYMIDHFDDEGMLQGLTHVEVVNLCGAHHELDDTGLNPGSLARIALTNPHMVTRIDTVTIASVLGPSLNNWGSEVDLSAYTSLKTLRLYTDLSAFDAHDALAMMEHLFHVDRMQLPPSLQTIVTNLPLDAPQVAAFMQLRPNVLVIEDPLGLDF